MPSSDSQSKPDDSALPVDLAHLRRFTLGDRQLEREILGLFADQLAVTISALRAAASDKDWTMATHTLKGSARAVGAWPLAELAEGAERMRPAPAEGPERAAVIDGIEQAAAMTRAFIGELDQAA